MMILQRMDSGLLPACCWLVISLMGFWQGITVLMCCRDMSCDFLASVIVWKCFDDKSVLFVGLITGNETD